MSQVIRNEALPADDALWRNEDTAQYLRMPMSTFMALNRRGDGPPSYRIGRLRRYVPGEVKAWLASQRASVA